MWVILAAVVVLSGWVRVLDFRCGFVRCLLQVSFIGVCLCCVRFRFLELRCVHASFVSGFLSRSWWVRGGPGVHHTAPAGLPAAVRLPGAGPELARSIRWIDKHRAQTAGPLNPRSACRRRRVQAHPARPAPTRPCLKCVVETVVFLGDPVWC